MATAIAVFCVVAIVACLPLVVLRPSWVFYIFLVFVTFSTIFTGYIREAGNLGLPRTWAPADVMAWLTLAAAFFVPRTRRYSSGVIGKCFIVIAVITALALFQGLLMYTRTAFTYSRVAHFVAAMLFALRYLTDYQRVNRFLKFTVTLLIAMFVLHVMIRFQLFTPPSAAEVEFATQLAGERGTYSLVPLLYLALVSIAAGRLVTGSGGLLSSVLMLLIGLAGIVLSETRSMYGAIAVMAMAAVIFVKGRTKTLIAYGLAGVVVVILASVIGFDIFARFRADPRRGVGPVQMPKIFTGDSWRAIEYKTIIDSYRQEPYFILSGRGIGAMHRVPRGRPSERGFYHSEYLGWLDRCGLIGLSAILVMLLAGLLLSYGLARCEMPYLRRYGVTCFLLLIALAADGVFHPIFSNPRGASMLICFVAVLANWRDIWESLAIEWETATAAEVSYPELAYTEPAMV